MSQLRTKTIEGIERKMGEAEEGSMRRRILENAKSFKTSWIDLGQSLYAVWKDRMYREWGYQTFEGYVVKEIGIKKATALKLLKSYYFLEKEEPVLLKKEAVEPRDVASVPSYESVNTLRLAKNKKALDEDAYEAIKKDVFSSGKDASDVRKSITSFMRQRQELEPEEARRQRRVASIKRLVGLLRALRTELEASKALPGTVLKETASLISKVESHIG